MSIVRIERTNGLPVAIRQHTLEPPLDRRARCSFPSASSQPGPVSRSAAGWLGDTTRTSFRTMVRSNTTGGRARSGSSCTGIGWTELEPIGAHRRHRMRWRTWSISEFAQRAEGNPPAEAAAARLGSSERRSRRRRCPATDRSTGGRARQRVGAATRSPEWRHSMCERGTSVGGVTSQHQSPVCQARVRPPVGCARRRAPRSTSAPWTGHAAGRLCRRWAFPALLGSLLRRLAPRVWCAHPRDFRGRSLPPEAPRRPASLPGRRAVGEADGAGNREVVQRREGVRLHHL
jgi:hypothetical protein